MKPDIRNKNHAVSGDSFPQFVDSYFEELYRAQKSVDRVMLKKALDVIEDVAKRKGQIFTAGNGGSAGISLHLCCDFTKGTSHPKLPSLRTQSLVANVSVLTALANDFSYQDVISEQVEHLGQAGDLLILISSSGNSPNILKGLEAAKSLRIPVIGLSGFQGGGLKEKSDIPLHVEASNYGIVEDCHQSIMHVLAQWIAKKRDEQN